jgi:nucleotide-binding universal stress UspA family protein
LGVDLHLATVVAEDGDHDELAAWLDEVRAELLDETDLPADRVHVDLRTGGDVVGELADAAGDDAILVVGSSRDWVMRENLFGTFTDELANRSRAPVVMVHRAEATPISAWRQVAGSMRRGGHGRDRHARSPS